MPRGKKREVGEPKKRESEERASEAVRLIGNAAERLNVGAREAMAEGDMPLAGRLFVLHTMTKDLELAIRAGDFPKATSRLEVIEGPNAKEAEKQIEAFVDGAITELTPAD